MNRPRIIFALTLIAVCNTLFGQQAVQVARKAFPSTVLIICTDSNGQQISLGSGFIVGPGLIATNFHVIDGAAGATVKVVGDQQTQKVTYIRNIDVRNDLAILAASKIQAPAVEIGDSNRLEVGTAIYAVGNPRGLEGSLSEGIISAFRSVGESSLLQITAAISPGSSGGPILDGTGKVVGVSVATYKGGQNLNFAIPSTALSKLLAKPDEKASFEATTKKNNGPKPILDELGTDKIVAGVTGSSLEWDGDISGSLGNGAFAISIRNMIDKPISNVIGLAIIYDKKGDPLDFSIVTYRDIIPSKLTKRVSGRFDKSTVGMTTDVSPKNQFMYSLAPRTKVEFRTLYFDINE